MNFLAIQLSPTFTDVSPLSPLSNFDFREHSHSHREEESSTFFDIDTQLRKMIESNLGLHQQKQDFWKNISNDILIKQPIQRKQNIQSRIQSFVQRPQQYFTSKKKAIKNRRAMSVPKNMKLNPFKIENESPKNQTRFQTPINDQGGDQSARSPSKKKSLKLLFSIKKIKSSDFKQSTQPLSSRRAERIQIRRKSCSCLHCGIITPFEFQNQNMMGSIKFKQTLGYGRKESILMRNSRLSKDGSVVQANIVFQKQVHQLMKSSSKNLLKAKMSQNLEEIFPLPPSVKENITNQESLLNTSRTEKYQLSLNPQIEVKCFTLPQSTTNSQGIHGYLNRQRIKDEQKNKRWSNALQKLFDKSSNLVDDANSPVKQLPMILNSPLISIMRNHVKSNTTIRESFKFQPKTCSKTIDTDFYSIMDKPKLKKEFSEDYQHGFSKASLLRCYTENNVTLAKILSPKHKASLHSNTNLRSSSNNFHSKDYVKQKFSKSPFVNSKGLKQTNQ